MPSSLGVSRFVQHPVQRTAQRGQRVCPVDTQTSLTTLRRLPGILAGIRFADELTISASRDGGSRAVRLLHAAAVDRSDQLTAIAAVHALAQIFDESADVALLSLLESDLPFQREHAAWAFGGRLPRLDAISALVTMVIVGGFAGMLAQRTLEQWGASAPEQLALAVEGALLGITDDDARVRLVETMGLFPGRIADRLLCRIAVNRDEIGEVRAAAIAALGDRPPVAQSLAVVTGLAYDSDPLADVARLALHDLTATPGSSAPWRPGLTVAQLFLHANIDRDLSQVGSGDTGGIATLLVRLGDALAASPTPTVDRVLTLSRGNSTRALGDLPGLRAMLAGHEFATIPFYSDPVAAADAWPRRVATQRGIRRILRAAGQVDVVHLRMADVGTLAATLVAQQLDIPVVFTVAPDPHAAIDSLDRSGMLTRENFGAADAREHFWFRVRLIQRLAADAAHLVLFPRPRLAAAMSELVGIEIAAEPQRHSVVGEGIDLGIITAARLAAIAAAAAGPKDAVPAAFADLDALLSTLPEHRRGLPLAITVGRLHHAKGMATLVSSWAQDAAVWESCNLLVVGGSLDHPSVDERQQLAAIDAEVPRSLSAAHGLLLAGHRSNSTVAHWLAAARYGRPGLAGAGGVYVCASVKEEFGLALLEALGCGLIVVAPAGGGPATYVEQGVTGFLVDTVDQKALAESITAALVLTASARGERCADRAIATVTSTFTIQAMASTLVEVYSGVATAHESSEENQLKELTRS